MHFIIIFIHNIIIKKIIIKYNKKYLLLLYKMIKIKEKGK